jgi:hypothetical protein
MVRPMKGKNMDYTKATKQTLIEALENLQKHTEALEIKVLNQGDIEATVQLKEQAIQNEFNLRKELNSVEEKHVTNIQLIKEEHFKTIEDIKALYEKQIQELKLKIVDPKELEATIFIKDQAVKNEHEARQELNNTKEELKIKEAQNKQISDRLNSLAALLEEYITTYEEDLTFYETVVKKNQYLKIGLRQKIENYNKGELK